MTASVYDQADPDHEIVACEKCGGAVTRCLWADPDTGEINLSRLCVECGAPADEPKP